MCRIWGTCEKVGPADDPAARGAARFAAPPARSRLDFFPMGERLR